MPRRRPMQNVEFKAELRDAVAARSQCRLLGASFIGHMRQTDTYFRVNDGRLKRREAPGEPDEWIVYERPNVAGPRLSTYMLLSPEQASRRYGSLGLKEWLRVVKDRELWMIDNVRIHIDEVEQLGGFLEFEARVDSSNTVGSCDRRIAELREIFQPCLGETIGVSYSDLLARRIVDTLS